MTFWLLTSRFSVYRYLCQNVKIPNPFLESCDHVPYLYIYDDFNRSKSIDAFFGLRLGRQKCKLSLLSLEFLFFFRINCTKYSSTLGVDQSKAWFKPQFSWFEVSLAWICLSKKWLGLSHNFVACQTNKPKSSQFSK